ncbi:hypothetical protein RIF29_24821 [Crotalaria pallida]|uniref:Uncharacterized protein n=1 Tax=Crotalaria pallida TaxID=3830 RepID=A0AAN9EL78_CROPI
MENAQFSSTASNFNAIHGGHGSIEEEFVFQVRHSFSGMELPGDINSLPIENRKGAILFQDQHHRQQQQQQQQETVVVDNMFVDEINFDYDLQETQPLQETKGLKNQEVASSEFLEYNKQLQPSLASLELLRNYASRFKRLSEKKENNIEASLEQQKLSVEEIIRVAGARYMQYSVHWNDNFCIPMHPYGMDLGGLSVEENRDIELAQFLLAAAEKVSCQQFERASRLLQHCQWNSSATGSSVQRVIFYFAKALRERIDKETGRVVTFEGCEKNLERELHQKMNTKFALTCHQNLPFNQVMQFTGIQAIVEHVASESKIHVIDLDINSGVQCTALMQALAERSYCTVVVELLKVTAIGLVKYKTKIEETGKRLTSFAESLNLPFSYKAVLLNDMAEIAEDLFEIEECEAVVVYSPYYLKNLIATPELLENLMRVIRNIKPSIMIVLETESNHNSPSFVNRFIEALFFYSGFFDCLETCLKEENECRMATEAILFEGIRNIVAMEGKERTVRSVKTDVWKRFFARYRMMETGFSHSSLYQANLVANEFAYGKFNTIDKNGKGLIIGWKGTPMFSLSAWRFI